MRFPKYCPLRGGDCRPDCVFSNGLADKNSSCAIVRVADDIHDAAASVGYISTRAYEGFIVDAHVHSMPSLEIETRAYDPDAPLFRKREEE